MAQKVQVILLDDVDGTDADETVPFGMEGVEYEIDLSETHAQELRDAMATWIGHARRTGGRSKVQNINARRPRAQSETDLTQVRDWARVNGYAVSDRGRISGDVMDAYKNRNKIQIPEAVVTSVEGVDQPQDDKAQAKPAAKGRGRKTAAPKVSA